MSAMEIRGRFLPSRVYDRWKWTVRFGLLIVSLLVFLAGGLVLYLTPGSFRSTTLFELENGPSPRETLELLESRGVLDRVSGNLELHERFQTDREEVISQLREIISSRVVPKTRFIELSVTYRQRVEARDIAEEVPTALKQHLAHIARQNSTDKAAEIDALIRDAGDSAEGRAADAGNLEKIHGSTPEDGSAIAALQRARRASLLADAEVERLRALKAETLASGIESQPRLIIHSAPVVSDEAVVPKMDEELTRLALGSLAAGLLSALLLPYLMELAFPPRRRRTAEPHPVIDL
jgi:hypothetical protein